MLHTVGFDPVQFFVHFIDNIHPIQRNWRGDIRHYEKVFELVSKAKAQRCLVTTWEVVSSILWWSLPSAQHAH